MTGLELKKIIVDSGLTYEGFVRYLNKQYGAEIISERTGKQIIIGYLTGKRQMPQLKADVIRKIFSKKAENK